MRDRQNISDISTLDIHWLGLNFYKPSSRFIARYEKESISQIPNRVKRIGVFVDESLNRIQELVDLYKLDFVQLHGNESARFCESINKICKVIKVFRIDESFQMSSTEEFENVVDYFLFDTNSKQYGGSGKKFNWDILSTYSGSVPFLLSGGIGPEDSVDILKLRHTQFVGIDINSKFELAPAVKSKDAIHTFLKTLNTESSDISS